LLNEIDPNQDGKISKQEYIDYSLFEQNYRKQNSCAPDYKTFSTTPEAEKQAKAEACWGSLDQTACEATSCVWKFQQKYNKEPCGMFSSTDTEQKTCPQEFCKSEGLACVEKECSEFVGN
jgi:hypothetical protein